MLLTRKLVKNTCVMAGFLTYPTDRLPSHPIKPGQWHMIAVDDDLKKAGAYSSGHCPGFPPGSLLSPDLRQETRNAVTMTNILAYKRHVIFTKKKYSLLYERYFYIFIASNFDGSEPSN